MKSYGRIGSRKNLVEGATEGCVAIFIDISEI